MNILHSISPDSLQSTLAEPTVIQSITVLSFWK